MWLRWKNKFTLSFRIYLFPPSKISIISRHSHFSSANEISPNLISNLIVGKGGIGFWRAKKEGRWVSVAKERCAMKLYIFQFRIRSPALRNWNAFINPPLFLFFLFFSSSPPFPFSSLPFLAITDCLPNTFLLSFQWLNSFQNEGVLKVFS